ncbi:hypothetical protein [Rubripirellula lacrimiformis]|nr:hypothetical protein [Rubripirellula lacrimiformis]
MSVLVAGAIVLWWLRPTEVTLGDHQYDVVTALYRVCNQRSADGLRAIEEMGPFDGSDEGAQAIHQIITLGRAGQWQDAAILCRQAMEDQVR